MPVTMKKIASESGVSVQTVSTVINGRPGIGAETRRRILEMASELGYRVNTSARNVRSGRTGAIGMLMNPVTGGFPTVLRSGKRHRPRTGQS